MNERNLPDAAATYDQLIVADQVVNAQGEVVAEKGGFDVKNEDVNDSNLPLYIANINGAKKYILPMTGNGLWGGIWGYIALNEDCNTIYGVYFSHASETPGLGAEIVGDKFQNRFTKDKDGNAIVKKVYDEAGNVALAVEKGKGVAGEEYHIDAVSGATITCGGLQVMLETKLAPYYNYLKNCLPVPEAPAVQEENVEPAATDAAQEIVEE